MEPEGLGLAVQTVFALLAWLPTRQYVEQAVVRLTERGFFVALTERGLVGTAYLREVMVAVSREIEVAVPSALDKAGAFNDAVNCLAGTYDQGAPSVTDVREIAAFAFGTAKRCASSAVAELGDGLRQNVKEALTVIAAFPDTVDALAAVADAVKVSARSSGSSAVGSTCGSPGPSPRPPRHRRSTPPTTARSTPSSPTSTRPAPAR